MLCCCCAIYCFDHFNAKYQNADADYADDDGDDVNNDSGTSLKEC